MEQFGIAGQNDLARRAGLSTNTVNRLVHGRGRPSVETIRAVADVLTEDGDTDVIFGAAGLLDSHDHGDWDMREVSGLLPLLSHRQRAAIVELIRSFVERNPQ